MAQFRKVKPGAPLHLRAEDWNAAMDAAQAHRAGPRAAPTPRPGVRANPNLVLVRNQSGSDQDRFAVLGIDAPIIGPTDNENQFTSRVGLDGVTPAEGTHEGRFVVLAEPIADGKIGRAWINGIAVAKVWVPWGIESGDDGYAEIADGDTDNLWCGPTGSARILWKPAGYFEQWAVIRFGAAENPRPTFWIEITAEASGRGGWYSAKRLEDDAETDEGTTWTDTAYAVHGVEGLPVGTIARADTVPDTDPEEIRFQVVPYKPDTDGLWVMTLTKTGSTFEAGLAEVVEQSCP